MNYKKFVNQKTCLGFFIYAILIVFIVSVLTKYKIFYIYSVMLFGLVIIKSQQDRELKVSILVENWMIIGLFISFYLSTFWAFKPNETFLASFWLMIFLVVYFIFYFFSKEYNYRDVEKIYIILLIVIFFLNFYILLKYGRIRGVGGSFSNIMAGLVEVCLPFVVFKMRSERKKLLSYVLIIMVVASIVVSESRGSLGILILFVAIMPVFWRKTLAERLKFCCLLLMIVSALAFSIVNLPFSEQYYQRVKQRITKDIKSFDIKKVITNNRLSVQEGDTPRMIQYHTGVTIIKEHPWTGIGYSSFKPFMKWKFDVKHGRISHNVFLTVWTGSGLIGLSLFLGILIKIFTNFWKEYHLFKKIDSQYSNWILANVVAVIIMLVHAQFRPLLINPIFYLPLATSMTLQSRHTR